MKYQENCAGCFAKQAEIEKLKTALWKTAWRNVKDRLPGYNVPVLTCDEGYPEHINPMLLFDSGEGWLWAGLAHSWNIADPHLDGMGHNIDEGMRLRAAVVSAKLLLGKQ